MTALAILVVRFPNPLAFGLSGGDPCKVLFNQPLLQSRGSLHADDSNALPHCNIGSGSPQHSQPPEKNIPLDLFLDSIRFHNGPCPDMEPRTLNNQESVKRNPDAKKEELSEARLLIFIQRTMGPTAQGPVVHF